MALGQGHSLGAGPRAALPHPALHLLRWGVQEPLQHHQLHSVTVQSHPVLGQLLETASRALSAFRYMKP